MLCTGRCGSRTLARALRHATNWTVGHERNVKDVTDRLIYPDRHVEVDNRLAFFLGPLAHRYPAATWVHLVRDPDATARSLAATSWRGKRGIMPAFAQRIIWSSADSPAERLRAARVYVATQTANIETFLADRPHIRIQIEDPHAAFDRVWDRLGMTGDRQAAHDQLAQRVR